MANTSGRVGSGEFRESFEKAAFRDPASSIDYHVSSEHHLQFQRTGTSIQGERQLNWFLGSGRVGRSYIFSMDGFLYQSPVSYYSTTQSWAASPGYQKRPTADFTRAVESACLQCHATGLRPVAGSQNKFDDPPFAEAGISCERCHGPSQRHIALMRAVGRKPGITEIVNPTKLTADRRDSVCAQCHLTGAARIARVSARARPYQPGDLLTDSVSVYAWSDARTSPIGVTSHFEKLQYSACQQASGGKLWCGSCHDPHGNPADGVQHYRQRCLNCHNSKPCALPVAARRASSNDCQSCHMPKADMAGSEHAVYTDHSIPRKPHSTSITGGGPRQLIPFWRTVTDERDSALAHAVAAMTEPSVRQHAFDLLRDAENRDPNDTAVVAQLAQFYDRMRQPDRALPLLERVVTRDPANIAAAINLGTLYAQQNRLPEAVKTWEAALSRNPALTGARLNLAVAQARLGRTHDAVATLQQALRFDPDSAAAHRLLAEMFGSAK